MFTLSDAGQPGTEIFNMPASTIAGKLFPPHSLLINIKVRGKPFMMHLFCCANVSVKHSSGCMYRINTFITSIYIVM